MTEREVMAELVRFVGVLTYGKERWIKQNGCWYDRLVGDYIQNEVLLERIVKAIKDEVCCDSADRPTGEWVKDPSYNGVRFVPVCSNCGKRPPRIEVGGKLVGGYGAEATGAVWRSELEYHQSDFCPSCGARMYKGGEEE